MIERLGTCFNNIFLQNDILFLPVVILTVLKVALTLLSTLEVVAADFLGEVVESSCLGFRGINLQYRTDH